MREASRIYGRAVPQSVNAGDGKWKLAPLPAQQPEQRAPDIAIADEGKFHGNKLSVSAISRLPAADRIFIPPLL
jgi:hypothetical protein